MDHSNGNTRAREISRNREHKGAILRVPNRASRSKFYLDFESIINVFS